MNVFSNNNILSLLLVCENYYRYRSRAYNFTEKTVYDKCHNWSRGLGLDLGIAILTYPSPRNRTNNLNQHCCIDSNTRNIISIQNNCLQFNNVSDETN